MAGRVLKFIVLISTIITTTTLNPLSQKTNATGNWFVADTGDDSNDCTSPLSPCKTIDGALEKASPSDMVYVDSSLYTSDSGDQVLLLTKDIFLSGGWNIEFSQQSGYTTLDGENERRVLIIDTGITVTTERLTIQGGFSEVVFKGYLGGGGILNLGNLTLSQSIVMNNDGYGYSENSGGGIMNRGRVEIINSTVSNNIADSGGGIYNGTGGELVISNSSVVNNTALDGSGGGIYTWGPLYLINSTVGGNYADGSGGGLKSSSDCYQMIAIINSTIRDNFGSSGGGFNVGFQGCVSITHSILAGNSTTSDYMPNCGGGFVSNGYNILGDLNDCLAQLDPTDLVDTNPILGELVGIPSYYPILAGSPSINGGSPSGCTDQFGLALTTDQRGIIRTGNCDIGAYEYTVPGQAAIIRTNSGTPQTTDALTLFNEPLVVEILDSVGSPVSNTEVTYTAPASGASGSFIDNGTKIASATTVETGLAIAPSFRANATAGDYEVAAQIDGLDDQAHFSLTNIGFTFLPIVLKPCRTLYEEYFYDPASGWPVFNTKNSLAEYKNGEYRILLKTVEWGSLVRPGFEAQEYIATVDVRNPTGVHGSYGILFGASYDWNYFKTFEIYSNGNYGVYDWTPYNISTLAEGHSPHISLGNITNQLMMYYYPGHLELYVNSYYLTTINNISHDGNHLGLAVFSYDQPNVDIYFDNFTVYPKNCPIINNEQQVYYDPFLTSPYQYALNKHKDYQLEHHP